MASETAAAVDQCVACGRWFGGNSKPTWALTRDGQPAGRVHASCSISRTDPYIHGAGGSAAEAQYRYWVHVLAPEHEYHSNAWWASMITGEPNDTLTSDQEKSIAWWITDGPLKLGLERAEPIRTEYRRLVQEFRAWQAGATQTEGEDE